MTATHGLSDKQAMLVAMIFGVFFAIQAQLNGLPEDQRPPTYVFTAIGIIGAAILPIKAILGIRDATTARVAKEAEAVNTELKLSQNRKPSDDQIIAGQLMKP